MACRLVCFQGCVSTSCLTVFHLRVGERSISSEGKYDVSVYVVAAV